MTTLATDVLIIGAGPAGATVAHKLGEAGVSSILVDKKNFPRDKICGDALSGKVVEALKKISPSYVTEIALDVKHFTPSWGVSFYSPDGNRLRVPFTSKAKQKSAPGFISKRIDFDHWFLQKALQFSSVTFFPEFEIREYTKTESGYECVSTEDKKISAKVVVACDGAYSSFSRHIASLETEVSHNCFGLRAYYENVTEMDEENFIELHFLPEILPGYFWIFPLGNGRVNAGVGMRADKLHDKKVNLKRSFQEIISKNPTISKRFEKANLLKDIKLFGLPLGSKKRKISGEHFLLCGDAAQLIDPFTGEGIGNAMVSGMLAAEQTIRCLKQQKFDAEFMSEYDHAIYKRLWSELQLSYRLQQLVNYPRLFNFVVQKANSNKALRETISTMFEDVDLRKKLSRPDFYLKLLFSR